MNLLSLNTDLNLKMKTSLFNISQRILTSGLNVSTATSNMWLKNINQLNEEKIIIGHVDKTYASFDCTWNDSETGVIEIKLSVKCNDRILKCVLETDIELNSYGDKVYFEPYHYDLVTLRSQEFKDLHKFFTSNKTESFYSSLIEIVITLGEKGNVLKPYYKETGELSFKYNTMGTQVTSANDNIKHSYQQDFSESVPRFPTPLGDMSIPPPRQIRQIRRFYP